MLHELSLAKVWQVHTKKLNAGEFLEELVSLRVEIGVGQIFGDRSLIDHVQRSIFDRSQYFDRDI